MKSRKSVKKSRAMANQEAQLQMHQLLDPAADQHLELDRARTEQEKDSAYDGSAAANRQDLDVPALPTNRIVSYPRIVPSPKMPATHFDIKADGEVETLVQPEQRVYVDADQAAWRLNEDGSKTLIQHHINEIPADFPVINIPVPQFVDDLETAIDGFLKDQPALDRADTASEIAAELLKHPALHGYLEIGEIAHGFVPDCEYQNAVELEEPADVAAAHFAQFERYAEQGENTQDAFAPLHIDTWAEIEQSGHSDVDFSEWTEGGIQMLPAESEQEFLGNEKAGAERWERRKPQLMAQAKAGIAALQELAGMAAEHKGFHEDRPVQGPELANWQGNKLMLIVSEAVEAHDEIRSGHSAYETYYPDFKEVSDEKVLYKPEGVPSEIADVVIRSADFAWTEGFDLADIIIEKLEYNATRGHKHGKAF